MYTALYALVATTNFVSSATHAQFSGKVISANVFVVVYTIVAGVATGATNVAPVTSNVTVTVSFE